MQEKAMDLTTTTLTHDNEGEATVIKDNNQVLWNSDTNWSIAHGSLEAAVTIESSDYSIVGSDPEISLPKPPLVLMPRGPHSGPCEIKIHFCQKYDIGQVYVRSTARVYEIYYAHSPRGSNEYLCTVRCGVAERDEKLYQTTGLEYVSEEHGDCFVGELTEDVSDGENIFTSEDDWVNVGISKVRGCSLPNNAFTKEVNNVQDLYEATAQISDADPCSSLTIRLLSLQDKGQVCVDEVYVFADPVDCIDSRNEAVPAGSSAGTSLMAMLVPTLLQLSKSGASQVQDKCTSDEVLKDDKMETEMTRIDEINIASAKNQVDQQCVKLPQLNKDKNVSSELQQPDPGLITKKCIDPMDVNELLSKRLDRALEQLISRVSRVEEICLRFEEKMLKPIENMELRLQQVEHQLEKLAKNADYSSFPHCTRIAAPSFSCSESNSSSLYNEGSHYPTCGASEIGKRNFSCNNTSNSSHDSYFRPTLVVSAPEFSCGEDGDNDDFKPLKDTPCMKRKKTLTVDDALAAALSGFLSTTKIHPSECFQTTPGLTSEKDENNQQVEHAFSHQMKAQEFHDTENGPEKSSQYTPILTVTAPEFTAEVVGDEMHFNCSPSSSDMTSLFTEGKDHVDVMRNEGTHDFGSAPDGRFPAVSSRLSRIHLGVGHLNKMPDLNMPDSSFEGDTISNSMRNSDVSPSDLTKDLVAFGNQIYDETNPRDTIETILDTEDITIENGLEHQSESTSDVVERYVVGESCFKDAIPNVFKTSCSTILDFETPILEVKFASDVHTNTACPLEALLDGAAGPYMEASLTSIDISGDNDGTTEQINSIFVDDKELIDLIPSNYLFVDLEVSAADESSNSEGDQSHDPCNPSSTDIFVSLI